MNYIRHLNTFFYYVKHDTSLTAMHVSLYMGLFQVWNSNRFRQPFPVFRDQVMQLSRIGSKNTYHKCLKELHAAGYIQVQPGLSKYMPAKIFMRDFEKHVPPVIQSDLFDVQGTGDSQKPTPTPIATSSRARLSPFGGGVCKPLCASGGGPLATGTTRAENSLPMGEGWGGAISEPVSVPDCAPNPPKTDTRTVPDLRPLDKPLNIIKESKGTHAVSIEKKYEERKGPFPPDKNLVEAFFRDQGQPPTEARKFYLYYQSIGWRVQGGTTPITDWKSTAEKWILNDKTNIPPKHKPPNNLHITNDKDFSQPL